MSFVRFNPFTGTFVPLNNKAASSAPLSDEEIKRIFNKVMTSDKNSLGNPNMFYDYIECKWVEAGPQIVIDSEGDIVLDDC